MPNPRRIKPRLLLLTHELSLTGAPRLILNVMETAGKGLEIRTLSLRGGPLAERFAALGRLDVLKDPAPYTGLLANTLFGKVYNRIEKRNHVRRLERDIARWQPDIIYVNSVVSLQIPELMTMPKVPVLLHVHELDVTLRETARLNPRWFPSWPDRFIAVSESVRQTLIRTFDISPDRIALVYSFVHGEPFADLATIGGKADTGNRAATEDRPYVVGGAGQNNWRKGCVLWLQMAARLLKRMGKGKVRFVWVGVTSAIDDRGLEEIARKLDLEGVVDFIPQTDTPFPHYAEFDVFALTSWEDPCPLVVIENMLLQKPVVCFAGSGGAPEELGDTGVVIPGFSPDAMAEAVADLAEDPDRRTRLGVAARERALAHFTDTVQAPRIRAEIDRLLEIPHG